MIKLLDGKNHTEAETDNDEGVDFDLNRLRKAISGERARVPQGLSTDELIAWVRKSVEQRNTQE